MKMENGRKEGTTVKTAILAKPENKNKICSDKQKNISKVNNVSQWRPVVGLMWFI